jgi:hypothetical protein
MVLFAVSCAKGKRTGHQYTRKLLDLKIDMEPRCEGVERKRWKDMKLR